MSKRTRSYKVELKIELPEWVDYKVSIFNGKGDLVHEAKSSKSFKLGSGNYVLQLYAFSKLVETHFEVVNKGVIVKCLLPVAEWQELSSDNYSSILTALLRNQPQQLILSVFFDTLIDNPSKYLMEFQLLDIRDGKVIELSELNSKYEIEDRAATVIIEMDAGYYRLIHTGDKIKQELTLHLYEPVKGRLFDTEVRLRWSDRPLFEFAQISAPHKHTSEHEFAETSKIMDQIVDSLSSGNRDSKVTSETVRHLLNDKYHNPLAGMMGLHLALMNPDAKPYSIKEIIHNLDLLVPQSPDLLALKLLAMKKGLYDFDSSKLIFNDVPMFKLGVDALYDYILDAPVDFSVSTNIEEFIANRRLNGVWSMIVSFIEEKRASSPTIENFKIDVDVFPSMRPQRGRFVNFASARDRRLGSLNYALEKNKIAFQAPRSLVNDADIGLKSWIDECFKQKSEYTNEDVRKLARAANVLPNQIRRALNSSKKKNINIPDLDGDLEEF